MSSGDSESVRDFTNDLTWDYVETAALVTVLYDTVLSFSDEVEYVWCRKLTLGSILYFLARYGIILQLVIQIPLNTADLTLQECNTLWILYGVVFLLSVFGFSSLLLARGYAICSKMPVIKATLFLLFIIKQTELAISTFRNIECDASADKVDEILAVFSCVVTMLFDSSIIIVTIYHIYQTRKFFPEMILKRSLASLFFKQGVYQFVIIGTWNFIDIIVRKVLIASDLSAVDAPVENVVAALLMCHFLIQLRKFENPPDDAHNTSINLGEFKPRSTIATFITRVDIHVVNEFGDHSLMSIPSYQTHGGLDQSLASNEGQ